MALATQPLIWPEVDSFSKGPSLGNVMLRTLGKEMAKDEQCSDWSQELTQMQIQCESRLSHIGTAVDPTFCRQCV